MYRIGEEEVVYYRYYCKKHRKVVTKLKAFRFCLLSECPELKENHIPKRKRRYEKNNKNY